MFYRVDDGFFKNVVFYSVWLLLKFNLDVSFPKKNVCNVKIISNHEATLIVFIIQS